jgi:alanine-synthesizing transaminase
MFALRTNWPSTPNALSQALDERRRQGLPLLDLTQSNPTHCGFSFDTERILGALADPAALSYEPDPRGALRAREAVAAYYAGRGAAISPQHIFLVTSTSEAYSYAFRLLANPGDALLVPRPSYPLLDFLAGLNDLEVVRYPLAYSDGWRIDPAGFEAALAEAAGRARAALVFHPNNPTGSFVHPDDLEWLERECCDQHLALIADEVFADYAWRADPERVATHAARTEVLTFTLSGLSKVAAVPQMKVAWMVVSGPAAELADALARLEVIADTYLSMNAPLACALPALLETRQAIQQQILERVRCNLQRLDQEIRQGAPISRLESEGGWYTVLRLDAAGQGDRERPLGDEELAVDLVRQDGVLVHPGHFYDFGADGFVVISLLPAPEIFDEALRRIVARLRATPHRPEGQADSAGKKKPPGRW